MSYVELHIRHAWSLYNDFFIHFHQTGLLKAIYEIGNSLLVLLKEINYSSGSAIVFCNQALILSDWGQFREAMILLKKSEEIFKQLDDQAGVAHSYSNQAMILKAWGQFEEAMALYKKSEEILKQLRNQAGLASSYANQALILHAWGQLEEAMALHKKQEEIYEQLGDQAGLINSYWNIGVSLREMKEHKEAVTKFTAAIKLEKKLKHPDLERHQENLAQYKKELSDTPGNE